VSGGVVEKPLKQSPIKDFPLVTGVSKIAKKSRLLVPAASSPFAEWKIQS
jgi:hypothetical protein